jgi:hypothetical protein
MFQSACRTAFCTSLAVLACTAGAAEEESGYLRVTTMLPLGGIGMSYQKWDNAGNAKIRFRDQPGVDEESILPGIDAALHLTGPYWLGGSYQRSEGESTGYGGKRVKLLFINVFVNTPTAEQYRFDVAHLWAGYRMVSGEQQFVARIGLEAIRARATLSAGSLGSITEAGLFGLPTLGLAWSGPLSGKLRGHASVDYGQIGVNGIAGESLTVDLSAEQPIAGKLLAGAGFKQSDLQVHGGRSNYQAGLSQRAAGPYLYLRYDF